MYGKVCERQKQNNDNNKKKKTKPLLNWDRAKNWWRSLIHYGKGKSVQKKRKRFFEGANMNEAESDVIVELFKNRFKICTTYLYVLLMHTHTHTCTYTCTGFPSASSLWRCKDLQTLHSSFSLISAFPVALTPLGNSQRKSNSKARARQGGARRGKARHNSQTSDGSIDAIKTKTKSQTKTKPCSLCAPLCALLSESALWLWLSCSLKGWRAYRGRGRSRGRGTPEFMCASAVKRDLSDTFAAVCVQESRVSTCE